MNARAPRFFFAAVLLAAALVGRVGPAHAQVAAPAATTSDPAFTFGQRAAVAKSVWLASANLGLLLVSGNSNVTTFSGGLFLSWSDPRNKLTLDASAAYARQHVLVAADLDGDQLIQASEVRSQSRAGAQNLYVKPRYDRFFTDVDSVYVSAALTSDILAGRKLTLGGQLGYSRKLIVSEPHEVTVEAGYDFTHERYVEPVGSTLNVHSARLFAGYRLKLASDVFAQTSVEGLTNIAPEETPIGRIGTFTDTRVNWRNMLSARVWKNVSGRFTFTARYDNWPASRPPFDLPYAPGVVVQADNLDTQTEFSVVVNFL